MKVYVAQINVCVGDLAGNLAIIQQHILMAVQNECHVIIFPELATVGYPPRDLLYSKELWDNHEVLIDKLFNFVKQQDRQITVIVGGLYRSPETDNKYNAAWVLDKHYGKRLVRKRLLPCYDIFDETRYFTSAKDDPYCSVPIRIGPLYTIDCDVLICEDIWAGHQSSWMLPATYHVDPTRHLQEGDPGPLFVLNGSPFWIGKIGETRVLVRDLVERINRPVVWCNQVGAHDDIITGGYSMIRWPGGTERVAAAFQEDTLISDLYGKGMDAPPFQDSGGFGYDWRFKPCLPTGEKVDTDDFEMWSVYRALHLHMTDYKRRCGFERAVLGLSGGLDSALVAVIAADVFGSENVWAIGMPSPHSSKGSVDDARELAKNLKIHFVVNEISDIYTLMRNIFLSGGKQKFDNPVADENLQPRIRMAILMGHSNELGKCILLTTGNKSEITVGYTTLYGDSAGGLAVLSDLWKTECFELARFINKYRGEIIPPKIIEKPPSAELRPEQQDTDSLLPYDVLDPMLRLFVEEEMSDVVEVHRLLVERGRNAPHIAEVRRMYGLYRNSEFKRQQMCIGPKISRRAYGGGRRMPVAMKFTTVG